jgi:hypothetical protein
MAYRETELDLCPLNFNSNIILGDAKWFGSWILLGFPLEILEQLVEIRNLR